MELVKIFANQDHEVLAVSRNIEPVERLNFKSVTSFSADITQQKDLEKIADFVEQNWQQVDILVHNAGAIVNKPFKDITSEEFGQVYRVNVFAVAELTRLVIPYMKKNGHVVTISSMGGVQGSVKFPGLSAYSSSKGAVITLTELLAEEYKETGPAFNVLALGAVQTEMLAEAFPGYRAPLSPEEMAQYIADFALNGNKFYNGKLLQVSSSTP